MRGIAIVAVVISLGVAACSSSPLAPASRSEGTAAPSFAQFSDVPVPGKATMDVDHSLLLGNGNNWVGRLVYTTWGKASTLYDFYKAEMPGYGWREITSVRAAISVQTWQRAERVATVQIRETTLGAEVILTMAPAVDGNAPPSPMAAPAPAVTRQRLQ